MRQDLCVLGRSSPAKLPLGLASSFETSCFSVTRPACLRLCVCVCRCVSACDSVSDIPCDLLPEGLASQVWWPHSCPTLPHPLSFCT